MQLSMEELDYQHGRLQVIEHVQKLYGLPPEEAEHGKMVPKAAPLPQKPYGQRATRKECSQPQDGRRRRAVAGRTSGARPSARQLSTNIGDFEPVRSTTATT